MEEKNKMSERRKNHKNAKELIRKLTEKNNKSIICIEDNLIFDSISKACVFYRITNSSMTNLLKKNKTKNGKTFKYL